tara:strand:- start:317 stop:436 length:120 start_codon:yes stop_codon:yes gene_type:complete
MTKKMLKFWLERPLGKSAQDVGKFFHTHAKDAINLYNYL